MSRYRKVDVRIWNDARFKQLSPAAPSGQHLWLYLLTNRHTTQIPGLYHAFTETMARDLRWPLEDFRGCLAEITDQGMAFVDEAEGMVWIPKAIEYAPPESPNVVKGWASAWDEMPDCILKSNANTVLLLFLEGFGKGFAEAFREACPAPGGCGLKPPSPNQEQEQEQEQEQDRALRAHARVGEPDGYAGFYAWWSTATGVLTPAPGMVKEVFQQVRAYAEASGRPFPEVADAALEAFRALSASWSVPQALSPYLFLKHWDKLQGILSGKVPKPLRPVEASDPDIIPSMKAKR